MDALTAHLFECPTPENVDWNAFLLPAPATENSGQEACALPAPAPAPAPAPENLGQQTCEFTLDLSPFPSSPGVRHWGNDSVPPTPQGFYTPAVLDIGPIDETTPTTSFPEPTLSDLLLPLPEPEPQQRKQVEASAAAAPVQLTLENKHIVNILSQVSHPWSVTRLCEACGNSSTSVTYLMQTNVGEERVFCYECALILRNLVHHSCIHEVPQEFLQLGTKPMLHTFEVAVWKQLCETCYVTLKMKNLHTGAVIVQDITQCHRRIADPDACEETRMYSLIDRAETTDATAERRRARIQKSKERAGKNKKNRNLETREERKKRLDRLRALAERKNSSM